MDDVLSLQKANAKICSNATALVDEAEEELGKIDGLCWRRPPSATHRNALQHTATYSSTIHKYIYTFTHNRLHMYVDIHRHDV